MFALTCRDCGASVDIPGRYGFKLKNTGISTTLCSACRQVNFLQSREGGRSADQLGVAGERRRWIPLTVLAVTVVLMVGGVWVRRTMPEPLNNQDALPATASPSR